MDSQFVSWRMLILLRIPALLIAGMVLLKLGLFPRRRGDDPYCAACNYLLIGNVSGRCPECGGDLSVPASTNLGRRHLRPGLAVVAIVLLLAGLGTIILMATGVAQRIDWYQYRPGSWVVDDLATSNSPQAHRAWNELDRRRKSPAGLSPAIEQKVIAFALKDHGQPTQGPLGPQLVDFLGDLCFANKLSKAQTDLFFTQAISLQLSVRPMVIVGDDAPYTVVRIGRCPSNQWWYCVRNVQAKLDDQLIRTGGSSSSNNSGSGTLGSYIKITKPGRHTLESTSSIEFYRGLISNEKASRLCYTRTVTLKADFQALEKAHADGVKLIDDPILKPEIRRAITVSQLERTHRGEIYLVIDVNNAPANVAFDVFAHADGKEYPVGYITVAKGLHCGCGLLDAEALRAVTANKLDFVLRSSESAARHTTDLFEIWSGQIVIEDVPVKSRPR